MCGPFRSTTRGKNRLYVNFINDNKRYGYIYLIKYKSETFERFKEFKQEVENQLGRKIKKLRYDRDGKYLSIKFHDQLKEYGIVSQLTPPRTPKLKVVSILVSEVLAFVPVGSAAAYGRTFRSKSLPLLGKER